MLPASGAGEAVTAEVEQVSTVLASVERAEAFGNGQVAMPAPLEGALTLLQQQGIAVCLLRGADDPMTALTAGDLDLLVRPADLPRLRACLRAAGWLAWQPAGHAPHHFFLHYAAEDDRWLKLDVVDRLAFGRPVKAIVTDLAASCWDRCRATGRVRTLAPEDELVVLLVHCLLDKGAIAERHVQRLRDLWASVDRPTAVEQRLRQYGFHDLTWQRLGAWLETGQAAALLAYQSRVRRCLAGGWGLAWRLRAWRLRLSRKWERWSGRARQRSLVVALLAPDGAGKSTLTHLLVERSGVPARALYLGRNPQAGGIGLPTSAWLARQHSGIGRWLARLLRFPNALLEQWYRYLVCASWRRAGYLVLLDRHPAYDERWHLPRSRLKSRLRRRLLSWGAPQPDLVLLLDAPGTVLYARKGEHDPVTLERQRQDYLALRALIPHLVTIDATQPLEQVYRAAMASVWRAYQQHEVHR